MLPRALRVLGYEPRRRAPRHCEAPSGAGNLCGQATREGKPYCPDHVGHNHYVQGVLEQFNRREAEEAAIETAPKGRPRRTAAKRAVLLAEDLASRLHHHGPATVERLARELALPFDVVEALAQQLRAVRRVSTRISKRGATIVSLRTPHQVPAPAPAPLAAALMSSLMSRVVAS